ncbi:UNVERIFIED_CONTAM: hypothetical protein Slati_3787900 [Sesamum latifolium]|uniref:Reverse transcriptase domain-containing protein n=1 Tax=Sesamum latifolium TaxID=2727402 RepID=A0AAW2U5Q1_9LAMI
MPLKCSEPDDSIISLTQSAFLPGRLISDNILLVFELNHFLNTKTKGGQGWMVLKLDISKAYDTVEWSFLQQEGRIQGVSIYRGAPSVSHFLFADDTLISFRASIRSTQTIREILEVYRRASGQEINFSKSSWPSIRIRWRRVAFTLCQSLLLGGRTKRSYTWGYPQKWPALNVTSLPSFVIVSETR